MERFPKEYRFTNLKPHRENPISNEVYDELDSLIAEINERLGIGERDFFYAYSLSAETEPAISVTRHQLPRGSTIGVTMDNGETMSFMTARNDAGTKTDPHQAAANLRQQAYNLRVLGWNNSLSANSFGEILNLVKERTENGTFVKNRRVPHILRLGSSDQRSLVEVTPSVLQ